MNEIMDIGSDFTKDGIKRLSIGQVLTFEQDGKQSSYKIVKRHVKRGELWVRPIRLYRPEEMKVVDKPSKA